jgi:hypothetical protein
MRDSIRATLFALLLIVFVLVAATSKAANDYAIISTHPNAEAARTAVGSHPNASIVPVRLAANYDPWAGTTQRVTFLTIKPTVVVSAATRVNSGPIPAIARETCHYTICGQACNGVTLTGRFDSRQFDTAAEFEAAYAALSETERGYTAKLQLPFGDSVRYVLVVPEAFSYAVGPTCTFLP